jgi:tripartite ATP-independent transporter DctP family solute receptor
MAVALGSLALVAFGAAAQDVKTFKVAYVQAKDHPHGLGAQKFADLVAQKSGNKMKVSTYGSGTLGGDAQVISSLQGGVVDMTMVSPGLLVMIKDFGLLDLPFLFNDYKEVDAVLDGPVGRRMLDKLPEKGLIGLAYWDHGFRNVTNSKRPITKAEDLHGIKIRVIQIPLFIEMFNAMGANAVPMPFPELYSALESKALDGQENPLATIEASKFFEVQKFVSLTQHVYNPLVTIFSKKTWDKLSPAEQKIIQEAAVEAGAYERKVSREANEKAVEVLKKNGMAINAIAPAEVARLREKTKAVSDKFVKEYGEATAQEIFAEIAKVRGK